MKYWHPDTDRLNALASRVRSTHPQIVLDLGASPHYRFPAATHTVGWQADINLNLSRDRLPFDNQSVDFVFCRHTLEDLADPGHLLSEIRRVAKAGYLETPSPLAELTRGVDAVGDHLGYVHHRWICFKHLNVFTMLSKYPIVERMPIQDSWSDLQCDHLAWNTCYEFVGPLAFNIIQQESGLELAERDDRGVCTHYLKLLNLAIYCAQQEHEL